MSEQEQLTLPLPRTRVRLEVDADPDAALERTGWEVNADRPPPSAGWWEVTDHATGTMRERWWFDPRYGGWWTGARVVTSAEFHHKEYAWQGLTAPHPDGYPFSLRASWPIQAMAQAIAARAADDFTVVPRGDDFDVVRPRARVRL